MEELQINEATHAGEAMDIDDGHTLVHEHGGVATRLAYDKLERMDLETFLKYEVPRLKQQVGDLFVVRNSVAGEVSFILGDCVLKYHILNMEECPVNDVVQRLADKGERKFVPDIQYPIISYAKGVAETRIVVEIPATTRVYSNREFNIKQRQVWLPPMWACIAFTSAGSLVEYNGFRVAIVLERTLRCRDAILYHWPFGNSWNGESRTAGNVCFGSTQMRIDTTAKTLTEGQKIQFTLDRFFTSEFNDHLLCCVTTEARRQMRPVYDALPDSLKLPLPKYNQEASDMLMMLSIISQPNGWKSLKLNKLHATAEEFISCGRA